MALMNKEHVVGGHADPTSSPVRRVSVSPASTDATISKTVWTIQMRTTATIHGAQKKRALMEPATTTLSTAMGCRTAGTDLMNTTALINTVPSTNINVRMATASQSPLCATTGMTVGTSAMSKAACIRAAVAVSLLAVMAVVFPKHGCATISMTVVTTVMRRDVTATPGIVILVNGDVLTPMNVFL